jgi:hypothetical protein
MPANALAVHPLCDLFPVMGAEEYRAFEADVRANGIREPIVTWRTGGATYVIDGRHRMRAAGATRKPLTYRTFRGDEEAMRRFVISANVHRRHLSESQRAMVGTRLADLPDGVRTDRARNVGASNEAPTGIGQAAAAAMLNVSRSSVQRARRVEQAGVPELIAAVEQGHVSVGQASQHAARIATLPRGQQRRAVRELETDTRPPEVRDADLARQRSTFTILRTLEHINSGDARGTGRAWLQHVLLPTMRPRVIEQARAAAPWLRSLLDTVEAEGDGVQAPLRSREPQCAPLTNDLPGSVEGRDAQV